MTTEPGHIVAFGGVGLGYPGFEALDAFVLGLARRSPANLCFVPTASADDAAAILRFYRAFGRSGHRISDVLLFDRTIADLRGYLLDQDVIYVKGGNTANLLALWRTHGLDAILWEALVNGSVLCGESAGMNCWFEASVTDSFGNGLAGLHEGLGFVAGSSCSHYNSPNFPDRQPTYLRLVADGFPAGYAAEDAVGLHFHAGRLIEVVTSRADGRAFWVERVADRAVEAALPARLLAGRKA